METLASGKSPIAPVQEKGKRELQLEKELSKPDVSKRIESMETLASRKVFIVHGQDEEKKEACCKTPDKIGFRTRHSSRTTWPGNDLN